MSLFPAYSDDTVKAQDFSSSKDSSKDDELSGWLNNSSYSEQVPNRTSTIDISSDSSDDTLCSSYLDKQNEVETPSSLHRENARVERRRSKHVKKRKKEKRKHLHDKERLKLKYERDVKNVYYEDKYRDKGNSTVETLCSRVRPLYNINKRSLGFVLWKNLKKYTCERYYAKNIDSTARDKKKDNVIKRDATKNGSTEDDQTSSWCNQMDEIQKAKIKEYNERLTQTPEDIQLWIEYIEFQDKLEDFQKYRTAKDMRRATAMKKLSIIDKALEKNVESTELSKLKYFFMGELMPADQFSKELETLVNKNAGDILLWQEFIMVTQASVAMCTVPKVLDMYSKCFCILKHKARTNPRVYDERLLQMLYWCLTFLRHTGLWEQMWETIRLNLCLNLSLSKDSLSFQGMIDEKKLIGMEEVILMSRLPLNQLWQRTESLRENCHWISVSRDELELVGDSRRFVLPDDVADFIHPILSRNSNFRMAIHSLLSLKVPLLPTRDCMLKELTLKEFEWGIESSEVLLPFAYPSVATIAGHKQRRELLNGILEGRLTSGPQYLMFHPAQEPYLDFIREIFRTIAESLSPLQRTSIYIWWLRFERLLIFLQKDDHMKHDNKRKKLRTTLKEFLKKEENRNNLHFYREYALIEQEMGKFDNCVNILETAIQSQGTCPSAISNLDERAALFSVYRTLFETLLNSETYKEEHRLRILQVFQQMTPGKDEEKLSFVEEYLETCVSSFLQEASADDEKDMFFLPNIKCDTIICYSYFLYTKDCDINRAMNVLATSINHFQESHVQEILYESQIALLQLHSERTQELSMLKNTVNDMLNSYPDNFYALSVFACMESELPIWKFNSRSTKLQLWRAVATCLASRRRIYFLKKLNDTVSMNAAINKLLSLHQTIARQPRIRNCPLLWRLYMLLLREYSLCEKKGEEVYHESVEQCPWARSIYIDAAEVAPQLLTQIQDVIQEKELRMHVTPEELNILRG